MDCTLQRNDFFFNFFFLKKKRAPAKECQVAPPPSPAVTPTLSLSLSPLHQACLIPTVDRPSDPTHQRGKMRWGVCLETPRHGGWRLSNSRLWRGRSCVELLGSLSLIASLAYIRPLFDEWMGQQTFPAQVGRDPTLGDWKSIGKELDKKARDSRLWSEISLSSSIARFKIGAKRFVILQTSIWYIICMGWCRLHKSYFSRQIANFDCVSYFV